jgi:hypothetical protein
MVEYTFRLRDDMPQGFRRNQTYPELPVAVEFLRQYEGELFRNSDEFRKALDGFPAYLLEKIFH